MRKSDFYEGGCEFEQTYFIAKQVLTSWTKAHHLFDIINPWIDTGSCKSYSLAHWSFWVSLPTFRRHFISYYCSRYLRGWQY